MERASCRFGIRRRFIDGPILHDISQVCRSRLEVEDVVHVQTAKVVVANYHAILHDFSAVFDDDFHQEFDPFGCTSCIERGCVCPSSIDQWLVKAAAYVSARQVERNTVNSPIIHGKSIPRAYRPPEYGRALVVPVDSPASGIAAPLIDIKGAGVAPGVIPSQREHADGLEYLGVALADFFYSWLVDKVLEYTVPSYCSVPVYAVLDLGFDVVGGWMGTAPAGLHVRRAHARELGGLLPPISGGDEERIQIQIEMLLRAFGLTSSAPYAKISGHGPRKNITIRGQALQHLPDKWQQRLEELESMLPNNVIEMINLQFTTNPSWEHRSAQLVDFGHIHARKRFKMPFASRIFDGIFNIGRILLPGDDEFVQPDPDVAINPDIFSRRSINAYGFYLAQSFRGGKADSKSIESLMRKGLKVAGF